MCVPHLPPGADHSSDGGYGCQLPLPQSRARGEISVHCVHYDSAKVGRRLVANQPRDSWNTRSGLGSLEVLGKALLGCTGFNL